MPRVRPPSRPDRLAELFEAHHTAVLGYATRRAASAEQAADVFSEVFLVAWRRLDDVPPGEEAKLWLFGVARRALANARRASRRHDRLVERLAATLPASAFVTPPPDVAPAGRIRAAIDRLGATDAELVRLVAWEGLTPREAAPVLGLSPELTRVRLHRARARLRDLLADAEPPQRTWNRPTGTRPPDRGGGSLMRDDDVWLDELLAAAAPVADHDLDRLEVRNASRALTEELSMVVPTTTRRITGDDEVLSARYADARPDEGGESAPMTLATAGSRRGWRPLVAAIAAAVVALGSAVYVAGGDRRDSPAEELGVAAPTAADGTPGSAGQQAEHPDTACEWTAAWFAADDTDDEIARRQAVAGLADSAAEAQAAGDEVTARRIEATMSPMSAGHREAAEQANAHLGC